MILINFKIYKETFGERAVELCRIIKEESVGTEVVVTASALDAVRLKEKTGISTWLQHVDENSEGRGTGFVSMVQAKELGIGGSLVNHSEHQLPKGKVLSILGKRPEGFKLVVCAKSLGQIEWIAKARPDWILYEPPELIASPDLSVASRPESIKKAVELAKNIPLMVGAGIKTRKDVEVILKMGAKGVGLASGLVLNKDPRAVIKELILGFNVTI